MDAEVKRLHGISTMHVNATAQRGFVLAFSSLMFAQIIFFGNEANTGKIEIIIFFISCLVGILALLHWASRGYPTGLSSKYLLYLMKKNQTILK